MITEEEDFILDEDDPYNIRVHELIENYFEILSITIEKIGNYLHAKFCEAKHLTREDSAFIEAELCKVIHPTIADMIDNLDENQAETFISSLDKIYGLMGCVQKNSRCEKRSIVLKLIELTKASQAYRIFNNFLRKHTNKK